MVSQLWQAVTSFVLQVLAARELGAAGLGVFALCFGVIVMATAVVSGVVGDSLTVLDRHSAPVRAGLQWWSIVLIGASSALGAGVLAWTGVLNASGALIFLVACALFQVEELLRRLLMTELRFWNLVVVDGTALAASVATLAVAAVTAHLSIASFLLSIGLGQAVGCVAALVMLPSSEKRLVPMRRPAIRVVAGFGLWRGAQVAINPSVLTGVRTLIVVAAGSVALGEVEAARVFVAPAVLVVQGLGSYLLASYVRDKDAPLSALVARATTASIRLAFGVLLIGVLAALAVPFLGHLVTGDTFAASPMGVFGWAVYAAASATIQPFASLAAARGRQRAVFGIRVLDSGLGIVVLVIGLGLGLPVLTTPFALAIGLVCGGILIRTLVLRPMTMGAGGLDDRPGPSIPLHPVARDDPGRGARAGTQLLARPALPDRAERADLKKPRVHTTEPNIHDARRRGAPRAPVADRDRLDRFHHQVTAATGGPYPKDSA